MKRELLSLLRCPQCGAALQNEESTSGSAPEQGALRCTGCSAMFPIVNDIPRFVSADNYASNFGFEWNEHTRTQVDSASGVPITHERFYTATAWPRHMAGERILEAGCGSGRFTEVALEAGATVVSFDYSTAVDANARVNGANNRLHLCQADIYRIPLERDAFDRVFCLGVLQHCPDPHAAFQSLVSYVRPGGHVAVDIYHSKPRDYVNPAMWLRAITKRMPHALLHRLVRAVVPVLLPIKVWMTEKPPFGRYLAFFIPIVSHKGVIAGAERLSWPQLVEWSVLDTFDHYSPRYDRGQRLSTVKRWFEGAGLKDVTVTYGPNGIIGRGRKPQ